MMNVDKMEAGRELDQLISEMFGFEPRITYGLYNQEESAYCFDAESKREVEEYKAGVLEQFPKSWIKDFHVKECKHYKHFSEDIKAAWSVFEKLGMPCMIAKSYKDTHGEGPIGYTVNWCDVPLCECMEGEKCSNGNEVWAETAPLAICRAALMIKAATP